jgi:hypothetical protein
LRTTKDFKPFEIQQILHQTGKTRDVNSIDKKVDGTFCAYVGLVCTDGANINSCSTLAGPYQFYAGYGVCDIGNVLPPCRIQIGFAVDVKGSCNFLLGFNSFLRGDDDFFQGSIVCVSVDGYQYYQGRTDCS